MDKIYQGYTNCSYSTIDDALLAGFDRATCRTLKTVGPWRICIADVSGHNSYGYIYAVTVCAVNDAFWPHGPARIDFDLWSRICSCDNRETQFVYSVTVGLTNTRNCGGGMGAYLPMFSPGAIDEGIDRAEAWIQTHRAQWH
jgi:hypothetical protein